LLLTSSITSLYFTFSSLFLVPALLSLQFPSFFLPSSSTPVIYTLSLHDALPILFRTLSAETRTPSRLLPFVDGERRMTNLLHLRSEEHTSELQSRENLVCRLLLEKKKDIVFGSSCFAEDTFTIAQETLSISSFHF